MCFKFKADEFVIEAVLLRLLDDQQIVVKEVLDLKQVLVFDILTCNCCLLEDFFLHRGNDLLKRKCNS